jgi:hypothetical protein
MTLDLDPRSGTSVTSPVQASSTRRMLAVAAGLVYAGVQLDGGITAAAYRQISAVPHDRLNFPFAGSMATATTLTWGLSQAAFVFTLVVLARSGAVGTSRLGRVGAWLSVAGGVVFVTAHAVSLVFRDARTSDPAGVTALALFGVASLLTAVGFLMAGAAVARAGRWVSWRRYTVLAVGVWMLCMVPLQLTFLLPVSVAVYAATVAAFAVALLCEPTGARR